MPDGWMIVLEAGAAVLYFAAACFYFYKKEKMAMAGWGIAVGFNGLIVIQNWLVNGYVPFVSMYQVITFLALVFAPIYFYMRCFQDGKWMFGYFSMESGVCMTGVCFMSGGGIWHFPPALQSVWFVPHILAYMIAYSLVAVAFIVTLVGFFSMKDKDVRFQQGTYHLMLTAFPFMTMGMFFGAIWANSIWGEFWSFDAKENWSLATWLMAALYLHFRRDVKLKKYAKIFVLLSFVGVIITMLFVNLMNGNSQHTYSM